MIIHSAGWLEGGLTVGYEKLITDMEVVNMIACLCTERQETQDDIGISALEEVGPVGHFFGCAHTMERYKDAFYEQLVGDLSNYGTWKEAGGRSVDERATDIWQAIIKQDKRPEIDLSKAQALSEYIDRQTQAGGALPVS